MKVYDVVISEKVILSLRKKVKAESKEKAIEIATASPWSMEQMERTVSAVEVP